MDRDRVEITELHAIKQLSQMFTTKIWDTAVFALTYANRVLPPSEIETNEKAAEWFKERIKEFQEVIVRTLVESGVLQDKAREVPVVPAGYYKPTRRMSNPRELYDRPDWFNPFWYSCANQMEANALIPLLASQKHRVKFVKGKTTSDKARELAEKRQELKRKEMEWEEESKKQKSKIEKEHQQLQQEMKVEEMRKIQQQSKLIDEHQKQEQKFKAKKNERHGYGENDVQTQLKEQERQKEQEKIEQQRKKHEEAERKKQELLNKRDRIAEEYRKVEEELRKLTDAQETKSEVIANNSVINCVENNYFHHLQSHHWEIEVSESSAWAEQIKKMM